MVCLGNGYVDSHGRREYIQRDEDCIIFVANSGKCSGGYLVEYDVYRDVTADRYR